ncbi:MAG TPA: hypothetical protein VGN57_04855 [Pirellulaceae bacterium]|jgi:hypothetical protein|nr:hypothetical protein [Pirellulaceae bacterium]
MAKKKSANNEATQSASSGKPPLTLGAPEPKDYNIRSKPIFLITRGSDSEVVVFEADMVIRAGVQTQTLALEEVLPLEVISWEAVGVSQLLGGQKITFRTTRDVRSNVKPLSSGYFFPGKLSLEIMYEVFLEGVTASVTGERVGTAEGRITSMPPSPTDVFDLDKNAVDGLPLTLAGFSVVPIACAC